VEAAKQKRADEGRRAYDAELQRQKRIAERWAKLSPEEKERRLEVAKREASILGHLMSLPGGRMLAATGMLGHQRIKLLPDTGMAGNGEVQP
jgi:transposase